MKVTLVFVQDLKTMQSGGPYRLLSVKNSTEWNVGERFSKKEVDEILRRNEEDRMERFEITIKANI